LKPNQFERSLLGNVRLHVLPTDRFKTFAISVYIGHPLDEEKVTPIALTPFILRRGTVSYPETIQFREHLDDLYGAGFGFDVYKRGDYQIVQFRMDIINDQFVSSSESLLKQGLAFIGETITQPAQENGTFRSKYVISEKDTLRKRIQSIVNDKIRYAAERCLEEMCRNEPYRLHPLGQIDKLDDMDAASLYDVYQEWLAHSPIDIYVVGDTTLQEVEQYLAPFIQQNKDKPLNYKIPELKPYSIEPRTIVEKMEVGQGKLNMGLRNFVTYSEDAYPAALMYNGILGAYPHSKLFINVREKASLAYYASSRYDGHKGIVTIQSGIEMANYEKAVEIIKQQLQTLSDGQIDKTELSQTRAMIANHLREIHDSAFEMIAFDFNAVLSGRERTVPELIEAIGSTDIAQIQHVASQTQLDTIYFLRDEKGE
jgi:predicted Zn-dependent peptidase